MAGHLTLVFRVATAVLDELCHAGLSASISGSDSDSDADDSSGSSSSSTNAVSRLLQKQRIGQQAPVEAIDELGTLSGPRSAVIWYEAPDVTPGTQYGVYRALLPLAGVAKSRADGATELAELKTLQLPEVKPSEGDKPRQWTLLMFGGGHFAGMVVSLVPKLVSKGKGKEKEREIVVLQKKTFHRYTSTFGLFRLSYVRHALIPKSFVVKLVGSREGPKDPSIVDKERRSRLELKFVDIMKQP